MSNGQMYFAKKTKKKIPNKSLDCIVTVSTALDFPHVYTTTLMLLICNEVLISWRPGAHLLITQFKTVFLA